MEYPDEIKELFDRYETDWLHVDTPEDWYPFILDCHKELLAVDPMYTIFQIKEKFGALRYYMSTVKPESYQEMLTITLKYERKVAEHERNKQD